MTSLLIAAAVALASVTGVVTDKTTGQPLPGVSITAVASQKSVRAVTDAQGRFTLGRIPDGTYTLHLSSHDVPPQTFHVRVAGRSPHLTLSACSTTLDYSCGGQSLPGGG